MSQNSLTLPTTGTVSGLQMTQYVNNALDTLNTLWSGASAPGSPEAGQLWHNTATNQLLLRDQANSTWMALFTIDETNKFAQPQNPASGMAPTPQGALTFTSNTPVMTADATAQTTIYYTPYVGNCLPIYVSGYLTAMAFSQLSLALNATNHLAGKIYDVFAFINAGSLMLGAGPAWTNSTTRSAPIAQAGGIWMNAATITLTNGATSYSGVGVNGAVYLGSFYCTANGQSGIAFKPGSVAGGSGNVVGLWNAYHRKRLWSLCRDSSNYVYSSNSWRAMDNSTNNRVTWLDGLGQSAVRASIATTVFISAANDGVAIGVNLNLATGQPVVIAEMNPSSSTGITALYAEENFPPQMGVSFVQAMEVSLNAVAISFNAYQSTQYLMLEGEY
jgi:hypothetical protein